MVRMTTVLDNVPEHLQHDVDAALHWFNAHEGDTFEVTGIVDPPEAGVADRELRLVLCGAGMCRQETFRVEASGVTWLADEAAGDAGAVAELDPPPGALRGWLDEVSARHEFVVLLFYRGFW